MLLVSKGDPRENITKYLMFSKRWYIKIHLNRQSTCFREIFQKLIILALILKRLGLTYIISFQQRNRVNIIKMVLIVITLNVIPLLEQQQLLLLLLIIIIIFIIITVVINIIIIFIFGIIFQNYFIFDIIIIIIIIIITPSFVLLSFSSAAILPPSPISPPSARLIFIKSVESYQSHPLTSGTSPDQVCLTSSRPDWWIWTMRFQYN